MTRPGRLAPGLRTAGSTRAGVTSPNDAGSTRTGVTNGRVDSGGALRLARGATRPRTGFFLRAESFFNVAMEIERLGVGDSYGDRSLHEQSHGESFFSLFKHRFGPKGFYILDEPEAALSPQGRWRFSVGCTSS